MIIKKINNYRNRMELLILLKYMIIGILTGYLLIYGLRPAVPYPESILEFYENSWLLIILIFFNFYIYIWDKKIGSLLGLSIIALVMDMIQFSK
jgi:hypothetical protein